MNKLARRVNQKTYIRIPFGEIQYGHTTKSLTMWFRGKKYNLFVSKLKKAFLRAGMEDEAYRLKKEFLRMEDNEKGLR